VGVAAPRGALDDRALRVTREVDQLDGELLDLVQLTVIALAALRDADDEPAVWHPRRRADVADRLQVAADRHGARRAAVGGDRERLAWLRLAAAFKGDPLSVGGPVGLVVDVTGGRIGDLLLVAPVGVDGEDGAVGLSVVEESPERDAPARQVDLCGAGRLIRGCRRSRGRVVGTATTSGEDGDTQPDGGDEVCGAHDRRRYVRAAGRSRVRALLESKGGPWLHRSVPRIGLAHVPVCRRGLRCGPRADGVRRP
jgi:hypothetical protein